MIKYLILLIISVVSCGKQGGSPQSPDTQQVPSPVPAPAEKGTPTQPPINGAADGIEESNNGDFYIIRTAGNKLQAVLWLREETSEATNPVSLLYDQIEFSPFKTSDGSFEMKRGDVIEEEGAGYMGFKCGKTRRSQSFSLNCVFVITEGKKTADIETVFVDGPQPKATFSVSKKLADKLKRLFPNSTSIDTEDDASKLDVAYSPSGEASVSFVSKH